MSFSISVKDYDIAAGGTLRLQVPGTFFQLMEATAAVDVSLMRAHSIFGVADDVPLGFSVGPLKDAEAFDGVEIYSATAQTVKVCISRGAVDLRSITQVTGTVSVVNGEVASVIANEAFVGTAIQPGVAGNYSLVELFNPAASGKNMLLSSVTVISDTAQRAAVRAYNASIGGALSTLSSPKKLGGTAHAAEIRYSDAAAVPGTGFYHIGLAAMEGKEFPFDEPILIPPGYGVVVNGDAVNTRLDASFQWKEVAV